MLHACDAHAQHDKFDFLRLTIERDEPVCQALIAAGASLVFAMLQLSGAL